MPPPSFAGRAFRGFLAELLAALWLQAHGCEVLGRRRLVAGVEVDLVVRTRRLALVVEVKSRGRRSSGVLTEDLVSFDQRRRLDRAAVVLGRRLNLPVRVDLVEIRWGSWPFVRWHRGPWEP